MADSSVQSDARQPVTALGRARIVDEGPPLDNTGEGWQRVQTVPIHRRRYADSPAADPIPLKDRRRKVHPIPAAHHQRIIRCHKPVVRGVVIGRALIEAVIRDDVDHGMPRYPELIHLGHNAP